MNYSQIPNSFTYHATISDIIAKAQRGTKEFFLRAGSASGLPNFLKALNYLSLEYNIATYISRGISITRNSSIYDELIALERITKPEDESGNYSGNLLYPQTVLNNLQLEDVFAVHLIPVTGQITEFFETKLPSFVQGIGARELLNVSLALKLTPKHRIRVYVRGNHILVFTTKGFIDQYDIDFKLHRKLWACIPYIRGWNETKSELTELYKMLDDDDATAFWNKLEQMYNTHPALKDLKYKDIIQTFNNINNIRLDSFIQQRDQYARDAENILEQYLDYLRRQREAERYILELNNSNVDTITPNTIKMLVDKKIAYSLDTSRLNQAGSAKLSYRCSAPCINFDKDAAKSYYKNRIAHISNTSLKYLYKLLFLDESVVVNFDEEIVLNFSNLTITAREGNLMHGNDYNICFPNQHHARHNCWGSYHPILTKLFSQYKLEELFFQIKAAVGSLNFVDYTVMSEFITSLTNIVEGYYKPACFYWRDEGCKTLHTYDETYKHFIEGAVE